MYFIYTFSDIDGHVVYVGITNDMQRRYSQHLTDTSNLDKYNWLHSTVHYHEVVDTAETKQEAEAKETMLIKHYKKRYKLFNKVKVYSKQEKVQAAIMAANARIKELQQAKK